MEGNNVLFTTIGIEILLGADGSELPTAFVATTLKEYSDPFVNPLTTHQDCAGSEGLHVAPPGEAVTTTDLSGEPFESPSCQLTLTAPVAATKAVTAVGDSGAAIGTTGLVLSERVELPEALKATAENV